MEVPTPGDNFSESEKVMLRNLWIKFHIHGLSSEDTQDLPERVKNRFKFEKWYFEHHPEETQPQTPLPKYITVDPKNPGSMGEFFDRHRHVGRRGPYKK